MVHLAAEYHTVSFMQPIWTVATVATPRFGLGLIVWE